MKKFVFSVVKIQIVPSKPKAMGKIMVQVVMGGDGGWEGEEDGGG